MSSLGTGPDAGLAAAAQTFAFAGAFALAAVLLPRGALAPRAAAAALLVGLTAGFQRSLCAWTPNRAVRVLVVDAAWVTLAHAVEMLVVTRVSRTDLAAADDGGEEEEEEEEEEKTKAVGNRSTSGGKKKAKGSSQQQRATTAAAPPLGPALASAVSLLWKWRRIGTRWQIQGLPAGPRPGTLAATRFGAALSSLAAAALSYLVLEATQLGPPPDPAEVAPGRVALLSRWHEVTGEELAFRAASTVAFLVNAVVGVIMFYNLVCAPGLITGLWGPETCLPYMGPVGEARSLRAFWGRFYHKGLRLAITNPADCFVDKVVGLRRGTRVSRYARLLLAFAISGAIHHLGEIAMDTPPGERGQFLFFSSQGLGVLFEDAVVGLYERSGLKLPHALEGAIGRIWLLFWLVWTVPGWFYPMARYMRPVEDSMLLFPVVKSLVTILSK